MRVSWAVAVHAWSARATDTQDSFSIEDTIQSLESNQNLNNETILLCDSGRPVVTSTTMKRRR